MKDCETLKTLRQRRRYYRGDTYFDNREDKSPYVLLLVIFETSLPSTGDCLRLAPSSSSQLAVTIKTKRIIAKHLPVDRIEEFLQRYEKHHKTR